MNQDTLKRIGLWGGAFLLLGLMVWGMAKLGFTPATETEATVADPVTNVDHTQGNPNAKVTLIEYSDFQCPACAQFFPVVEDLIKKYSNDVRFVYRFYPLPGHDKSDLASRAAEAAGKQGKFWEMHDRLFSTQSAWSSMTAEIAKQTFTDYATGLGLNKDTFLSDLNASSTEQRIQKDVTSGDKSNVNATPTFFINGKKVINLNSYADLESDLTDAISQNK